MQLSSNFSINDGQYLSFRTRQDYVNQKHQTSFGPIKENDLFLKPEKCEFNKSKVEYLGMIIEEGRISMDPGKLNGIRYWPAPTIVKQVQGFLWFGNFYQQFIQNFSELAKPLNELLKKE